MLPISEPKAVPQVLAFAAVTRGGRVGLTKAVRQHLDGGALYFDLQDEILLTNQATATTVPAQVHRTSMTLSEAVMQTLGVRHGALLAMVEREGAAALKAATAEERPSDHAELLDIETPCALTRIVCTTLPPDELLPRLRSRHQDTRLRYAVRGFLAGRATLPAWHARKLLDCADPADDALREQFLAERLVAQEDNGSWDDSVILTARALRELADLGLTREDESIQRAVGWLMARPQSEHNPGQWFATDALVAEQAGIVAARQQGKGGRFRQLKTSEKKRVMSGDDLIQAPCGPRIMWPTGLVLEALLKLGYEEHARVQIALRTLTTSEWCECGYQHGLSGWRQKEPLTDKQLTAFEQSCIAQYRYGGVRDLKWLTSPEAPPRIAHEATSEGDRYALRMPCHIQGCEFITTRSLSRVQHPAARRFAEAHLWRFAGIQRADGTFPGESYGSGFPQAGILEAIARYDHPASHIILLRALPWMVATQNQDGSWGEEPHKDLETLAIVHALEAEGTAVN